METQSNTLVTGENVLHSQEFIQSLFFPWKKRKMELTNKRLRVIQKDTLLGIIPLGNQELTYPIVALSSVLVNKRVIILRPILAFLLFVFSVGDFMDISILFGLLGILFSVYLAVTTVMYNFTVVNEAGEETSTYVYMFESKKISDFSSAVNNTIIEVKTKN